MPIRRFPRLAAASDRPLLTASGRALVLMLTAALLCTLPLVGCSSRPGVPRTADDVPGYLGAPPNLAREDATPLRGRRILLDPGHGGRFPGAVGPGGLTEAEVNLGVALYLQGMLQWAGAEVHLTRTANVDFLTPADSSLTADLAARVAICEQLQPDVFLSIHHNSTASGDPTINETQTYYPLGREGADLDLARSIHRRLVLMLEIEPARILPGGFHVLRNVTVPAVLGEPAMISNPVMEGRLTLASSLELEASAYFLGLRDYFRGGSPRWQTSLPDTVNLATAAGPLVWTFDPGDPRAPSLDPATVSVTAAGQPLRFALDPAMSTLTLLPRDLPPPGRQGLRLELAARNLAGRSTPLQLHQVHTRRNGPWRTHLIHPAFDQPGPALLIYHNEGQPLRAGGLLQAGLPVVLEAGQGASLGRFTGHRGWQLLDPAVAALAAPWRLGETAADGSLQIHPDSGPHVSRLPAGWRWLFLTAAADLWSESDVPGGGWHLRQPLLPAAAADTAITGDASAWTWLDPTWPVVPYQPGRPLWLEAEGCRPLVLDAAGHEPWAASDPAAATLQAPPDSLAWQALLPALVGRRVVVDPQGGGTQEQGRGPFGTRGSDLNVQVARRLAALLRGAGCEVLLLRDGELHLPESERIRRADRFGAHFYLALGRGQPQVRHHPGSTLGRPWAASSAAMLGSLLGQALPPDQVRQPGQPLHAGEPLPTVPAPDYVLRHTACPALVVLLEQPETAVVEDRLTTPAWQDAEARALLMGLVGLLHPEITPTHPDVLLAAMDERALPRRTLSHVRIDGNFQWLPPGPTSPDALTSWQTGDRGLPLTGGRHLLELHAGPHWQLWALTRGPEGAWHAQILQENR